ncbi:MAG: sigma-70 family RNA polymerase sigma factor [Clostridiaceae bacterium]|nr:sigma-70 family RNA polymerase sigma factor [Clostridiaceae bacterium]
MDISEVTAGAGEDLAEKTRELIRRAQAGDDTAAETLVTQNAGLIWSVVRRFFGRGQDSDDLYQLACVGFIKAVRGFDMSYGTQFSTYAVPKIAGEIRRFLRDDGPVKVSRSIKDNARRISCVRHELEGKLGRMPTLSELSAETGLEPEEIAVCETATAEVDSLQRPVGENGDEGFTLESALGTDGIEDNVVERESLYTAIASLPEREKAVVHLRFFRGFTQERVAKILGVSQVQVSRIERRAIASLRTFIG